MSTATILAHRNCRSPTGRCNGVDRSQSDMTLSRDTERLTDLRGLARRMRVPNIKCRLVTRRRTQRCECWRLICLGIFGDGGSRFKRHAGHPAIADLGMCLTSSSRLQIYA